MEAWKQSVQAIKVATGQTTESQRQGWTVAAALIWYLRRKRRAATDARTAPAGRAIHGAAQADGAGQGVVVFDVETTQLIDDGLALEDMEVSVATAMWLPAAHAMRTTRSTEPRDKHSGMGQWRGDRMEGPPVR